MNLLLMAQIDLCVLQGSMNVLREHIYREERGKRRETTGKYRKEPAFPVSSEFNQRLNWTQTHRRSQCLLLGINHGCIIRAE